MSIPCEQAISAARTFVAMPSRREETGRYRDIIHPITAEARLELEEAVLAAYNQALAGADVQVS